MIAPEAMITPEMLGVILPMLGFSILLNFLLFAALLFRPLSRSIGRFIATYWLGVQLMIRN
jgi:hypothetical protein